jgi:excisionase family DNA binding protein
MIQETLSLKQAAELAGVSKVTLWRLVTKGEVEATQDEKGRYLIRRETFLKWRETLQETLQETIQETAREAEKRFSNDRETMHEAPVKHTETAYETVEMVPADLHRMALENIRQALENARRAEERAERAERQMKALGGQLIQYQQVLQERAESLFEKEARVKQAELLERENAERLSLYEQEKQQWALEVETAKSRVNWLEKRVPKWVRGLFGAG